MSASPNSFLDQKKNATNRHPAQRAHEMDDQEKIFHLKQEIDNLRNQLREANGGSINRPTTSSSSMDSGSIMDFFSGSMAAMVVLLLAVLVVVRRRWQNNQRGYRYASGTRRSPELTITLELQDAHDYAMPPPSGSMGPADVAYVAPSSSTSQIQFV